MRMGCVYYLHMASICRAGACVLSGSLGSAREQGSLYEAGTSVPSLKWWPLGAKSEGDNPPVRLQGIQARPVAALEVLLAGSRPAECAPPGVLLQGGRSSQSRRPHRGFVAHAPLRDATLCQ
jgi:hypothetical protein